MCDCDQTSRLEAIAHRLRIESVRMTEVTKSGHPTSCASIAEIMSVLFFHEMKYSVQDPKHPSNDRLVLSKGHAAPILYAAWAEAGLFPKTDLAQLRLFGSDLEGHPTPRLNFVDVATGSLGQGIGVSVGMAYDGLYVDKSAYRVFCILGDGECMEGSVWEAAAFAGFYKLKNLVVIVDVNELGQSDYTSMRHDMGCYKRRWEAFGFHAQVVDGQNVSQLVTAFEQIKNAAVPVVILAKTLKGAHFPEIEGRMNWHGKPLGADSERVISHLQSLIKDTSVEGAALITAAQSPMVDLQPIVQLPKIVLSEAPKYALGSSFSTREAGGVALAKLGQAYDRVVVCDADVKNSTFTNKFKQLFPNRFVDCYIAEQNMVSVATGLAVRLRHPVFVSTFSAFLSRAHDQIRMASISLSNINIIGTHCGVSIGEDGGSQMGLEDLAIFRCLPDSVVLYPSDAVSAERAVELAANVPNLTYLRMSRPSMKTIYSSDEVFQVGKSKVCLKSASDQLLIVAAGVTLIESLDAAELLAKKNIKVRVLDVFSVKPLDVDTIVANAREAGGKVLTVEDHYPEGGIGEMVAAALAARGSFQLHCVCVTSLPRSGKPKEVMKMFGLTGESICERVERILGL